MFSLYQRCVSLRLYVTVAQSETSEPPSAGRCFWGGGETRSLSSVWWCSVPVSGGGRPGGAFAPACRWVILVLVHPTPSRGLALQRTGAGRQKLRWSPEAKALASQPVDLPSSVQGRGGAHPDVFAHPHFLDLFARNAPRFQVRRLASRGTWGSTQA